MLGLDLIDSIISSTANVSNTINKVKEIDNNISTITLEMLVEKGYLEKQCVETIVNKLWYLGRNHGQNKEYYYTEGYKQFLGDLGDMSHLISK